MSRFKKHSLTYLYTHDKLAENKMKETIPFTVAFKKLTINPVKNVKNSTLRTLKY